MASNSSNRKRNQKTKTCSHPKNTQGENPNLRIRDPIVQQWQQQPLLQQKQSSKQQSQQQNKQQQQLQHQQQQLLLQHQQQQQLLLQQQHQQHQQQSNSACSKATVKTANNETSTPNINFKPRTAGLECYIGKRKHNTKSAQDSISNVSLQAAIFWRRQDLVESFLQSGSTAWEVDQHGNTAFMVACRVGDIKIMSVLWDIASSNLNIQHTNKDGDTALHICAGAGQEDCCRFLISHHAKANTKNKTKDTPLHLAAKSDYVGICNMLLNASVSSAKDSLETQRFILEENDQGQTAICVSILHQHAQITRMLLDMLSPKEQAIYLNSRLQRALKETLPTMCDLAGAAIPGSHEVFLHGLLVSLSVLLICFAERAKQDCSGSNLTADNRVDECLLNTTIVQIIVGIASNRYVNKQIVPISCFLLIYLMEGVPEKTDIRNSDDEKIMTENKIPPRGRKFLEQFLNCNGPNDLLLKVNNNMELSEPHDSVITIALALTIVSLVRSPLGRSWLESNRCHLTFLKEILLQNRSILSLLTTTCPLLTISYLESICHDFVKQVEMLEARDREQNLVELLWEEERDRKRRERKKQKQQQKKQNANKDAKSKNVALQIIEVSSDDEMCYHNYDLTGDNLHVREKSELFVDDKTMEIDPSKVSNFKANLAECQVSGMQSRDSTCNNLDDDTSSSGSESHCIGTRKEKHGFPSKMNESMTDSIKSAKVLSEDSKGISTIELKQEEGAANKHQGKESGGALSTMMRWADVAKIGCGTSGKSSLAGHAFAQSGVYSEKLCNWPLSSDIKTDNFENSRLTVNVADIDTFECNIFEDTPCYDIIDPCPTVDANSDEETSPCSSSSIESHFQNLRSHQILQSNLSVASDSKANHGVLMGTTSKTTTVDQTQILCRTSPSRGRRKRRKSKLSKKVEQGKMDTKGWSPQNDKSVFHTSSDGANIEDNSTKTKSVIKPLSITGDHLISGAQSDNIIHSSWPGAVKSFLPNSKDSDKTADPSISSQKCNPKRKDMVAPSAFRSDVPAILPPLKITRELSHCKEIASISGGDDSQLIETNETLTGDIRSQISLVATQKRQSFCSKTAPLTRIKSKDISLYETNTVSNSTPSNVNLNDVSRFCQTEALPCSSLSTLTFPSSIAQSLLSTVTISTQYTPPPPGFQFIKQPVSVQNVKDIVNLDKSMQSYNKMNINTEHCAIVPSSGKKGRVITTVLLDKVKNPPVSLQQQNKIPLLSTLAWNCGQESRVAWSKLLQTTPTTVTTASIKDNATTQSLFPSFVEQGTVATFSNAPSGTSALSQQSKTGHNNATGLPGRCTIVTGSNFQTNTTFSTILVKRMQQRNNNRDNINNLDILEDKPLNNKVFQSTLSVQDLATSSILDVSMSRINNRENTSQQYPQTNSNSTHQSLHNQHHRQTQQPFGKVDAPLQSHVFCRGYACRSGKESVDVGGPALNSQYIGKRQSTQQRTDSRCTSPPVFFPEQIRDQTSSANMSGANFPAFHEVHTSDFLSEMFSDPLFTDNIAVNQIRQKIQSSQSSPEWCDVDLDYYASLYQMKFRDVLGNLPGQSRSQLRNDRQNTLTGNQGLNRHDGFNDGRDWHDNHGVFGTHSLPGNQIDTVQSRRHSLRWHRSLQKILDLPWTTRKQFGNIILPHPIPEFSIGMAGSILIGIGFLSDGTEIAVLIVDKALVQISPQMVEIISSPEMDKHCLTRCKSFNESPNVQYIAMDLYEYNLCEYLQVCLTACNQHTADSDLYTGLVWQLLQALGFLHHKLCVPHGHLAPCWIFINADGHLRLAGLGMTITAGDGNKQRNYNDTNLPGYEYRTSCWGPAEEYINERTKPSFYNDIRAAGKLAYFIITKGQHLFGAVAPMETEMNLMRDHLSSEVFDLISPMLTSDPQNQPSVDQCLKHPMFWSGDKKFRLILIVGSDVLTEMRTGIALTGTGAPTMMEILSQIDINMVSPNWIHEVDSTVLKEMKSFRVYKNNLAELTLFVYNCCLHFDKLSNSAKEVLDDPCKYFQNLFPSLFIAIHRSLKSSDRTDRTCYKPFF